MDFLVAAQPKQLLAGRYEVVRLLGSGGFGAVYLANDQRLHRQVAIKVCSTRRLPTHEAQAAAQLFQKEALTLARLHHPGLTAIWDYFNYQDEWYLVMEYVPGESLRMLMRRIAGPLPQAEAFDYARQLCSVLSYLHQQHPPVVFRDLKPANIMVTPEGRLKLIDFGIARLFSPGKASDTVQFGTPGYAPPEQYGGQTEPRSDVYSLGVVLHEMLTGYNPAASPFALPPLRTLNPAVPEALDSLVVRATSVEIRDRIPSATEFCRELDAVLRPSPVQPARTARPAQGSVSLRQPASARSLYTPAPRALPSRPESSGVGRAVILLVLLAVLFGALAFGAHMLRSEIATVVDDLRQQSEARVRPDANAPSMIVFTAPAEGGYDTLYKTNFAQGRTGLLANFAPNVNASQPTLSPDGKQIAFTREVYPEAADPSSTQPSDAEPLSVEVWVMQLDGTGQRRLLEGYALARSPAWSPDGAQLAVEVAQTPAQVWRQHDIVLVNLRSGAVQTLVATDAWEGGATWSPDGKYIAYHARLSGHSCMQLFATDVTNGATQQLTVYNDTQQCETQRGGDFWPAWSPDGKEIAFGRKLAGKEQLALFDTNNKSIQVIYTGEAPAGHPRWSKDGRYLLFEEGAGDQVSLARLDMDTREIANVDTGYSYSRLADWW